MKKKKISILGSTGSIGTQTLDVIREHSDLFEVYAISANSNIELIKKQIKEFKPKKVVIFNKEKSKQLELELKTENGKLKIENSMSGLINIAKDPNTDILVTSIVGAIGLKPTMAALKLGKIIALANKETMVAGGEEINSLLKKYGGEIRPIDSEHSAIWQSLRSGEKSEVKKIWLTASGGPFRDKTLWPKEKITKATANEAIKHPTWKMGAKITIDSATLANKGLEFIEAMYLFDLNPDQIEIVVHPQSIVHSAVEFNDGSIIAELGATDMRRAISYALTGEKRPKNSFNTFSFFDKTLSFEKPDFERFPCLNLAIKAAKHSQNACKVFNDTNEIAVEKYLKGEIGFYDISEMIERKLNCPIEC